MNKRWILFFAFSLSACASQPPQAPDLKADKALGVNHEEQAHEAVQDLNEIQKQKIDENQQNLQRQINDPLH